MHNPEHKKQFEDEGFDVARDLKSLDLSIADFKDILLQILIELDKTNLPLISQCNHIKVLKIRAANPRSNTGKSGGLRVFCMIDDLNCVAIPFHIIIKNGSSAEADLSQTQKNRIKIFVNEIGKK